MKIQDKEIRYYIDINLKSRKVINFGYKQRDKLQAEKSIKNIHRIYLTKGQYNKFIKNLKA
jgi:hypothetical protein